MNFFLLQKRVLNSFSIFFVVLCAACTSKNQVKNTIDKEVLGVQIHKEEAQNPQKRNKNKLEGLLIKKADSFYFASNFKQAQTLYDMALNNVTDAETKKYLIEKIAETKGRIEENSTKDSVKK
ncbi:hypothetical protein V9L05_14455 [Bernardetia sp. Wsw4-3y2]|uniref:hypothetical protein n=1 Tax=Bernardetia sp. Wsw4-3y2 TaxID=3127471 RepID=UPI0030CEE327